jgi:hypothetical protein
MAFERDLGDGWRIETFDDRLILRHDRGTGVWVKEGGVDEHGVFETGDYLIRIPVRVLAVFCEAAVEWRRSRA